MKLKIEIDPDLDEAEIVIRAPQSDDTIANLTKLLKPVISNTPQFSFYKNNTEYFIDLNDVLFFETSERNVHAHTINDALQTKYKLFELEQTLPSNFVRVAKSTIVNVNHIFAMTRSISNVLIEFKHSHKQVYASRRYVKQLNEKINQSR